MKKVLARREGSVEPMLVLALAIVVLAVIGFAAYLQYSERINFFKFLPDFGVGEEKAESIEIVGYNIKEGTAEYYDGTEWRVVPVEGVRLGGKRVLRESLLADFGGGYWYNLAIREELPIESKISSEILRKVYPKFPASYLGGTGISVFDLDLLDNLFGEEDLGKGYVRVALLLNFASQTRAERVVCGIFYVSRDNSLFFEDYNFREEYGELLPVCTGKGFNAEVRKIGRAGLGEKYDEIVNLASVWRDSILEKPINIRYLDAKSGEQVNDKWFCVEFISEGLVVRLNEEVARDAKCLA